MSDTLTQVEEDLFNPTEGFGDIFDAAAIEQFGELQPEDYLLGREQVTLVVDQPATVKANLGKSVYESIVTLKPQARLSTISLLYQPERIVRDETKGNYYIGSYYLTNVGLDVIIVTDSGREWPLIEVLRRQFNTLAYGRNEHKYMSPNRFQAYLATNMGMRPTGRMNMACRQFATPTQKWEQTKALFTGLGATVDNVAKDPNKNWKNIRESISWDRDANPAPLEVSRVEIGVDDRNESEAETPQGFQDPAGAMMEHMLRNMGVILAVQRMRNNLDKRMEANDRTLTEENIRDARAEAGDLQRTFGRGSGEWGGSHTWLREDGTPAVSSNNVPSGRVSIIGPDGNEHQIDIWPVSKQDGTDIAESIANSADAEDGTDLATIAAEELDALDNEDPPTTTTDEEEAF